MLNCNLMVVLQVEKAASNRSHCLQTTVVTRKRESNGDIYPQETVMFHPSKKNDVTTLTMKGIKDGVMQRLLQAFDGWCVRHHESATDEVQGDTVLFRA